MKHAQIFRAFFFFFLILASASRAMDSEYFSAGPDTFRASKKIEVVCKKLLLGTVRRGILKPRPGLLDGTNFEQFEEAGKAIGREILDSISQERNPREDLAWAMISPANEDFRTSRVADRGFIRTTLENDLHNEEAALIEGDFFYGETDPEKIAKITYQFFEALSPANFLTKHVLRVTTPLIFIPPLLIPAFPGNSWVKWGAIGASAANALTLVMNGLWAAFSENGKRMEKLAHFFTVIHQNLQADAGHPAHRRTLPPGEIMWLQTYGQGAFINFGFTYLNDGQPRFYIRYYNLANAH